ncbi:MAG: hypothetical protein AAF903_03260 [Pseudomonadota bacterium]
MTSDALQAVGLFLDIVGFAFLVNEAGTAHRASILVENKNDLNFDKVGLYRKEAEEFSLKYLKKIAILEEVGASGLKLKFLKKIVNWQMKRKFMRVDSEIESIKKRQRFAGRSALDILLERRVKLMFGASLVFLGFSLQLIGTIIGMMS